MKTLSNELTCSISGGQNEEVQYYGRYIVENMEDGKVRMIMCLVAEGDLKAPKAY
jgi:hypothetical protein